ncbi:ArsR family transcriptional regulator [uncultured Draconibacterium sp.]|uniref:ArsR family transcriptional regulator n=1 Tax=uncultured Draconibacterium sp. TaxID=1573823 RepID=UPI002AA87E83|nr:ArsR family transcriptional regulator [uncultured Draconibacterium sp.]
MLESLITNKTRLKLLFKFFLNKETTSYLRNLESEFGESTNAIRIELNRLENAGLLLSHFDGNKKIFKANDLHPLYDEINRILQKTVGLDMIVDHITTKIKELKEAYLIGDLAIGKESGIIDILLVGEELDSKLVAALTSKTEMMIDRKIRYLIVNNKEKNNYLSDTHSLLIFGQV